MHQNRHYDVPAGILPVVPAMRGGYRLWMHECGNVEGWLPGNAPADGGCDACESGSDDAADWRPLFVEPRRPAAGVHPDGLCDNSRCCTPMSEVRKMQGRA